MSPGSVHRKVDGELASVSRFRIQGNTPLVELDDALAKSQSDSVAGYVGGRVFSPEKWGEDQFLLFLADSFTMVFEGDVDKIVFLPDPDVYGMVFGELAGIIHNI